MLGALVCHVSCKLALQRCSIRYHEGRRENDIGFGAASWQRIVNSGLISSLQMLLALALLAANRARAAAGVTSGSKQLCMNDYFVQYFDKIERAVRYEVGVRACQG